MNSSESHAPLSPEAQDHAALWAARLDGGSLTDEGRQALETWLSQDPRHRTLLSRYCQLSTDLEQRLARLYEVRADDSADAAPGTAPLSRRPAAGSSRAGFGWRWASGLGLAAAAIVVVLFVVVPTSRSEFKTYATAVAQRQELTLADGSQVELNAQTSLAVELDRKERRVRLAQGEAFFEVSKDPARPFIIETPAGSVRVTGTRFNVRADRPSELQVTVAEGSVQVRPADAGPNQDHVFPLTPGQQLTSTAGHTSVVQLSALELSHAMLWRQGVAMFANAPLQEALAQFGRYHGRGLTATPAAAGYAIGGRFRLDDLDGFLATLEEAYPLTVTHRLNGTVQIRLRSE